MASPRILAEELGFTEGPVWTADARLLVTSISHGAIYEVGVNAPRVLAKTQGGPNGMTEGKEGALYVAQNGGVYAMKERSPNPAQPGIQVIEGNTVRYLAEGLDAPNDCCFGPDGRLYFTDPRGSVEVAGRQPGRVYAMDVGGAPELLAEGPAYANGIAFGPDASQLYVAETLGQRVLVYPCTGDQLGEPREFCHIDPGFPDGMCFDDEGRLYVAATMAEQVQVFDIQGRCIDRLPCGDSSMPTNCCFGGPEARTLFVTDSRGERVLAFDLEAAGLPLFPFR
jgi:gluconolactonase